YSTAPIAHTPHQHPLSPHRLSFLSPDRPRLRNRIHDGNGTLLCPLRLPRYSLPIPLNRSLILAAATSHSADLLSGNICRSPAAEAVFTDLVRKRGAESKFKIDSAGTIGFHEAAARRRGIDVTSISRPIKPSDFRDFDLILAMDMRNRGALYSCAPFVKSTTKQKFQILIMEAHKVLK
ncbi:hypothetical protein B296_00008492, partial [Ensete ventricosum]